MFDFCFNFQNLTLESYDIKNIFFFYLLRKNLTPLAGNVKMSENHRCDTKGFGAVLGRIDSLAKKQNGQKLPIDLPCSNVFGACEG